MLSVLALVAFPVAPLQEATPEEKVEIKFTAAARVETIEAKHTPSLDLGGTAKERKQGGSPRKQGDLLIFDGPSDGNRQVDPQVAVGGKHVLTATNSGLIVYDKQGNYVRGVTQNVLAGGIDPKLFFSRHAGAFGMDLWVYWDEAKTKPVNISFSETDNPMGAWNTYGVPAPGGVDGGAIGYSKEWVGYSFPGGEEKTFVMRVSELQSGKPASAWHFKGSLGHPVFGQDAEDALYFLQVTPKNFVVRRVLAGKDGAPVWEQVGSTPHGLEYIQYPPQSPQKGTEQLVASGDRNPKNVVLQGGYLWFSQTVNVRGRAGVQWHQINLDGSIVQTGLLASDTSSYIQSSLAVNDRLDVLVGFQELSPEMFVSPRMAVRMANDPKGKLRPIQSLGEGQGATSGGASWGDYSGSCVDGDDGLGLWTIQSIASEKGRGRTVVGAPIFDS